MLERNQHIVGGRCGLRVDIPSAVPLFGFGKGQFKRMAVICAGESNDGFMLPAVPFVVRLGEFDPQPGKADFADQGFNAQPGTATISLSRCHRRRVVIPAASQQPASRLRDISRGFAILSAGLNGKLPTLYVGVGKCGDRRRFCADARRRSLRSRRSAGTHAGSLLRVSAAFSTQGMSSPSGKNSTGVQGRSQSATCITASFSSRFKRAGRVNQRAAGTQGMKGAVEKLPLGSGDFQIAFWRPVF